MHLKRIELIALIVVVLVGGAYAMVRMQPPVPFVSPETLAQFYGSEIESDDVPAKAVDAGLNAHIEELETRLASSSGTERAALERQIAERTVFNKVVEGTNKLKAIAANESYPARERALAVEVLASIYFDRSGNAPIWAEKYIFNDGPYAAMYDQASTTNTRAATWNALAKLAQYALSIDTLPISAYRLALWYERHDDDAEARKRLAQADAVLDTFVASLGDEDAYMAPKAYRLRAEALDRLRSKKTDAAAVHTAFDTARAMAVSMRPESDANAASELMWIDYRYLLVLEREGVKDGVLEKALVTEFLQHNKDYFAINLYIKRLGNDKLLPQALAREKKDVIAIANRSPEFKTFLMSLGWSF